jgi:hypothetical protein
MSDVLLVKKKKKKKTWPNNEFHVLFYLMNKYEGINNKTTRSNSNRNNNYNINKLYPI